MICLNRSVPFHALLVLFVAGLLSLAVTAHAAGDRPQEIKPRPLFDAIDAGEADVRLIPADASRGQLLIKNLTKQPLVLRIPDAFAAIPEHQFLAQFAGPGNGFPGQGFPGQGQAINVGLGNGQGGGTQALGGGNPFGPQNGLPGGQNGAQPGNVLFRIPPQAMKKVAVATVCLEHGKREPSRRAVYRLIPLDHLTDNSQVAAVCRLVGSGQIDQKVGQAIAWHFANELSWDELRNVNARVSRYLGNTRMFHDSELEKAKALAYRLEQPEEVDTSALP